MPLTTIGTGTKTRPVLTDPAIPTHTLVPSRREAVESLEIITKLTRTHDDAVLVDNSLISWEDAIDCLRRFILTR